MSSLQVRKMTYAALYLAIAMVLPFITGQIPEIGSMLCPMHIPALLCGFMCGWPWGVAVGFVAPLLRSVIFGMPVMFPTAVPKKKWTVYIVLILSMIAGRIVWGVVRLILAGLSGNSFTWSLFIAGAVTNAIPGIIMHIVLIPVLVILMDRAGLTLNKPYQRKGSEP